MQKLTCAQLHKKAEKIACLLLEKGQLSNGDHAALIFPPSVDLVAAFYGCLYIGVVPVPIRPPHVQNIQTTLPTIKMISEMGRIKAASTSATWTLACPPPACSPAYRCRTRAAPPSAAPSSSPASSIPRGRSCSVSTPTRASALSSGV